MFNKKILLLLVSTFIVFNSCESELDRIIKTAENLWRNEKYSQAIVYITEAMEKYPKSSLLFSNRGYCYFILEQDENALNDFNDSIQINRKNADGYNGFAMIYNRKNQDDLSEINFNKAIKFAKNKEKKSVYLANMAQLFFDKEEYEKAFDCINQAIKLFNNSTYYYHLGVFLFNNEKKKEAEETWLSGLEMDNYSQSVFKHRTYNDLAVLYFNEENYIKAKENMEKALDLSPNDDIYKSSLNTINSVLENY